MARSLFDVAGRHVVVTGGSKGIGEMISRGFHAAGAVVYVSARAPAACEALADELGDRAHALPADVSTQEGCRRRGLRGRSHDTARRAGQQRGS